MSGDNSHLIFAILRFFEAELVNSKLPPDAKETLEVASQCLENVYKVNSSDDECKRKYPLPASLSDIFKAGLQVKQEESQQKEVPPEKKEQAEKFKSEGNTKMKQELFQEAVDCYTSAIDIDGTNSVYYCNRAAAYSKLNKYQEALGDCDKALDIDPGYSKAYGRKGLAHSALNQHKEAVQAFERAVELDQSNESFKKNLEVAEQKLAEQAATGSMPGGMGGMPGGMGGFPGMGGMPGGMGGMPGGMGFPGGMDLASLMNNPALMNMATQMMSNPQMQELMGNMLAGFRESAPQNEEGGARDIAGFLQAGQQMAQQFQEQNPDLINQLRTQAGDTASDETQGENESDKPTDGNGSAS